MSVSLNVLTEQTDKNIFSLSENPMGESTDINRCILLVNQPSTESLHEDMEMEDKVQNGTTMHNSHSYLLNVEDCRQSEKHLKIGRSSSVTSRLSINSQIIDLPGTLKWIYIIIPMLCAAFLIGVFVGSVLSTLFTFR